MDNEQLTQNEVNKLVHFSAKYLNRLKKYSEISWKIFCVAPLPKKFEYSLVFLSSVLFI
jgi:hypothetical protein